MTRDTEWRKRDSLVCKNSFDIRQPKKFDAVGKLTDSLETKEGKFERG